MIVLADKLAEAVETFNQNRCEDDQIDYWEVVDEITDTTDEKAVREVIQTILQNI